MEKVTVEIENIDKSNGWCIKLKIMDGIKETLFLTQCSITQSGVVTGFSKGVKYIVPLTSIHYIIVK